MKRINISIPWPFPEAETKEVIQFSFWVAIYFFAAILLFEIIDPGSVTTVFPIYNVFWVVVILGFLNHMFVPEHQIISEHQSRVVFLLILLSVGSGFFTFSRSRNILGVSAYLLGIISMFSTFALGLLALRSVYYAAPEKTQHE
jgi:hypothetical protein